VAGVADSDPSAVSALLGAGATERLSWADIAAVARALCELGQYAEADTVIGQFDIVDPEGAEFAGVIDNARSYLHGMTALAANDAERAVRFLGDAYASAPGESACALALAAALTATGDPERLAEAADLYEEVAVADPSWVAAIAGLAWTLHKLRRPAEAARVLTAVPTNHPLRAQALTMACQEMAAGGYDPVVATAAGDRVRATRPGVRDAREAELATALYEAALAALARGEQVGKDVGGQQAQPAELRRAAEGALLELAEATPDTARRHQLLDAAARTRPWSFW